MKKILTFFLTTLGLVFCLSIAAVPEKEEKVVNVYAWANMIPRSVIKQFEKENGIRVNYSEYDNNETLYAKLKANPKAGYDVIQPSSYYVSKMKREDMLAPLEKKEMPNFKYLNPILLNRSFDPHNDYSVPSMWGATGIVVDDTVHDPKDFQEWKSLWDPKLKNQILMLDDEREAFGVALMKLGYSFNDGNPAHLKQACEQLIKLRPNIKLFAADAEQTIYVDGDVTIGLGWSLDIYHSQQENKHLRFIYPKPTFPLSIDTFAIPKEAPHFHNAMLFINFLMRPDIAKQISLHAGFLAPNTKVLDMLPAELRNNPVFNPSAETLARGEEEDELKPVSSRALLEKYWQKVKNGDQSCE